MSSLQIQTIKSIKWSTLQTGIVALIGVLLQVIKARYLSPEGFAYLAIVMIFIGFFKTLEKFGISQAIIQRDAVNSEETSSLFFFNIFISVLFGLLLFLLSPAIASFFQLSRLDYLLKFTSLLIIFSGPSNIFRAICEKQLLFKELSVIEMIRSIIAVSVITVLLHSKFGILGVITGYLAATIFSTASIIYVCFMRKLISIKIYFSLISIYSFLRFGFYVSGKEIFTFIAHRLDEVIIGYFLAPEVLGFYHFGKNMIEKVRSMLTATYGKVLFPVFSIVKNKNSKISMAYLKISYYISMLSFPIFAGITITAHLFVPLIFGEQWVDSVVVFQVFSLTFIFLMLTAGVGSSLLYSMNKPDTVFCIDVIASTLYVVLLMVFAPKGMDAVLVVFSLYVIGKSIVTQHYANKMLLHGIFTYLNTIRPAATNTAIMAFSVLLFQKLSHNYYNLFQLIGSIFIGVAIYLLLNMLFQGDKVRELKAMLTKGYI